MQLPSELLLIFGRGKMDKPQIYQFYIYAKYIRPMTNLPAGTKIKDNAQNFKLLTMADVICDAIAEDDFCKTHLPSMIKRARQIHYLITENYLRTDDKGGTLEELSQRDVDSIHDYVHAFETSLQDDLGRLPVYLCEDSSIGNLSMDKLLNGASHGYPKKISSRLTQQCKDEIDEAGKCLVFERSTAAGFHILRSVELTIRQYLLSVPSFVMPPLNRQNWGEYLKLLKDNGAARDVTDHLHNIKDNYRNPLMHPEDTLAGC